MKWTVLIFAGIMPASMAAQTCTANAFFCSATVSATAPPGGSCMAFDGPSSATVRVYDANGNLIADYIETCSRSIGIDPC